MNRQDWFAIAIGFTLTILLCMGLFWPVNGRAERIVLTPEECEQYALAVFKVAQQRDDARSDDIRPIGNIEWPSGNTEPGNAFERALVRNIMNAFSLIPPMEIARDFYRICMLDPAGAFDFPDEV